MAPSSQTTLATLTLNVRSELGVFNDVTAYPDARIADYLNEGQAWMLPDVTRHLAGTFSWIDNATSFALPADLVRIVVFYPDVGSVPPAIETDGSLVFLSSATVQAASGQFSYEGAYPKIDSTHPCVLPDPGNEGLVAFATWRILDRLVVDRDDYRRYSTQTGSNVVAPADIADLANLYQQRYSAVRDNLAQRTSAAPSAPAYQ